MAWPGIAGGSSRSWRAPGRRRRTRVFRSSICRRAKYLRRRLLLAERGTAPYLGASSHRRWCVGRCRGASRCCCRPLHDRVRARAGRARSSFPSTTRCRSLARRRRRSRYG